MGKKKTKDIMQLNAMIYLEAKIHLDSDELQLENMSDDELIKVYVYGSGFVNLIADIAMNKDNKDSENNGFLHVINKLISTCCDINRKVFDELNKRGIDVVETLKNLNVKITH